MNPPHFCLLCDSSCCLHLQESHATLLNRREVQILQALVDPQYEGHKQIAFAIHLGYGTLKQYLGRIFDKLHDAGIQARSSQALTLWAIANREKLQIELPTPEQFRIAQNEAPTATAEK